VLLAFAYVPECLLMLPGSLLTLGSGFAFGLIVGTVTAWSGSLMGASAAFLTGRYFARDLVESKISSNPKFQALDRAVAGAGFKIVLLTRLSPLFPFNVLNYAFGLTGIGFRDYVLASALGMLPGTVLYVYLGSAAKALSDLATVTQEQSEAPKVYFFAGLVVALLVTFLLTRLARRALAEAAGEVGN
jgi:uncharacterized membrane protein YdjX (TVP38/TMEM64 family)